MLKDKEQILACRAGNQNAFKQLNYAEEETGPGQEVP